MVLDALAVLAFLHAEPGAETVREVLEGAIISVVNWSEVVHKSLQRKVDVAGMQEEFFHSGLIFEPFSLAHAQITALLYSETSRYGLSLADRACLALAIERKEPVLTADRVWAKLKLDIPVIILR